MSLQRKLLRINSKIARANGNPIMLKRYLDRKILILKRLELQNEVARIGSSQTA